MVQIKNTYSCLDYLESLAKKDGPHWLRGHVECKTHQCINPKVSTALAKAPFMK